MQEREAGKTASFLCSSVNGKQITIETILSTFLTHIGINMNILVGIIEHKQIKANISKLGTYRESVRKYKKEKL